MVFGETRNSLHRPPMPHINIVSMGDVMLVLLERFIVTAPLPTRSVKVELPKAASTPNVPRAHHVELAIRGDGSTYWNGERQAGVRLDERFRSEARRNEATEVHLRADKAARYEWVARAIVGAKRAGLGRIGFVTEPGDDPMSAAGAATVR